MKHRKLRIAWSVGWGVMAVLLIALWVRSYTGNDYLCWMQPSMLLGILPGESSTDPVCSELGVVWLRWEGAPDIANGHFHFERLGLLGNESDWANNTVGIEYQKVWLGRKIFAIRYRTLVPIIAFLGVAPWLSWFFRNRSSLMTQARWRFSLRTLLIATTLVAVVLGTIIVLSR